jgi:hypothetical protein
MLKWEIFVEHNVHKSTEERDLIRTYIPFGIIPIFCGVWCLGKILHNAKSLRLTGD